MTTPVLHWAVGTLNERIQAQASAIPADHPVTLQVPDPLPEAAYVEHLAASYKAIKASMLGTGAGGSQPAGPTARQALLLDCAHGVGAGTAVELFKALEQVPGSIRAKLFNVGGEGTEVNLKCGADFVQKEKVLPANSQADSDGSSAAPDAHADADAAPAAAAAAAAAPADPRPRASIDGDADRLVWFFMKGSAFRLLDGDKMTALISSYIMFLLKEAGIAVATGHAHAAGASDADAPAAGAAESKDALSVGAVQTAYANGASTVYLTESIHIPVACTCTGVKYLHHEAKHFDIGIYFEANGHGTVLFR